jgi:small subunit ribosomal protein S17
VPKKEKVGVVVSNKMDKTIVVEVPEYSPHPKYKKIMVNTKNYKVSDDQNECNEGDKIRIIESRPTSKTKRWRVAEIVEKAQ